MASPVQLTRAGSIALIEIDNPPVNALGHAVRAGLVDAVARAEADPDVTALVILGAGRTFPAGADIREFGKAPQPPTLSEVVTRIEDCAKPVIAALHGTALGGGLEIALGAHYRIAEVAAKVGLPEVTLGILPGAGGTQRLPRIIGAAAALDLMLSGKPIPADKALALGVLDRIATGDLRDAAMALAREVTTVRRSRERRDGLADPTTNAATAAAARSGLERRARGQIAPFRIVDCVETALSDVTFAEGLAFEAAQFRTCLESPQSVAMVHAFFAERAAVRVPEAVRAKPRPLDRLAVIGGGTMGAGIAVAALEHGLPVTMIERDADSLARGRATVEKVFARALDKGRISSTDQHAALARFAGSTDYADLAEADLVIEAVFEQLQVKQQVFRALDAAAKPGAILASNTSYIDIARIAEATSRPGDVIGLHFFSPANVMKLLEIVVPEGAADDTVATGFALARRLGKVAVRAGNRPGFIGNRILRNYTTTAAHMVEDGASPYDIDRAVVAFGFPMGPHAMFDLAGLDIGWANRKAAAPTRDPADRYVAVADRLCERGWFGQKTGRGYYLYPDGARRGQEDPEVLAIIAAERVAKGIAARSFDADEILRRYLAAMVNTGCEVLREGVALKPSDIDVTLINGYGFPRHRGGPMHHADVRGLDLVLAELRDLAREDPRFWTPSPLLVDLVETGRSFDDMNRAATTV